MFRLAWRSVAVQVVHDSVQTNAHAKKVRKKEDRIKSLQTGACEPAQATRSLTRLTQTN